MSSAVKKILIVGCGDLGSTVAEQLTQLGMRVIGVRRTVQAMAGVTMMQADVTQPTTLAQLCHLHPDIIIYCVAAMAQSDEAYLAAYVVGLSNVLATQVNNPQLQHVFFTSSTRVYGLDSDGMLDEASPVSPVDYGGERLLEAEAQLATLTCSSTVLRLSGIYGPGRTRMIRLAQSLETWPAHNHWSNRIHQEDAAGFIVHLVANKLADNPPLAIYIVTDSAPATQHEVLSWISQASRLPSLPIADVTGGKRLANRAMLATGFQLKYPNYQVGYQALLLECKNTKKLV